MIRSYKDHSEGFKIDTVIAEYEQIHVNKEEHIDSLFLIKSFIIDGVNHEIRKYSNIHCAPPDGEYVFYELDSLGVIFHTQITWGSERRLYSKNDSINRIIEIALLKVLSINEYEIKKYFQLHPLKNEKQLDFRDHMLK